ncbi:hypothetical protein [Sphingomonas sp. 2378]|uniref:hypothetical protein n=1 Tax=Sphingomonas sp. 2378 TaxID=1219748 RepID=UPI00311B241B
MQRLEVGQRIATALFESENAIDAALIKASDLISLMSTIRLENQYSATIAAAAMEGACATIRALGEARTHLVGAHGVLDKDKALIGLGQVRLAGTGMGKPEHDVPRSTGLHVVG